MFYWWWQLPEARVQAGGWAETKVLLLGWALNVFSHFKLALLKVCTFNLEALWGHDSKSALLWHQWRLQDCILTAVAKQAAHSVAASVTLLETHMVAQIINPNTQIPWQTGPEVTKTSVFCPLLFASWSMSKTHYRTLQHLFQVSLVLIKHVSIVPVTV